MQIEFLGGNCIFGQNMYHNLKKIVVFSVTMTTKKNWLLNNSEDLVNKSSNDLNISWSSSSSSENDFDYNVTKKFKSSHNFSSNFLAKTWIKVKHLSQGSNRKDNKCDSIIDNTVNEDSVSICSQFTCEILQPEDQYKPSSSSNHSFEESPIIGTLKFEELSPVLSLRAHSVPFNPNSSPTIGKNRMNPRITKIVKRCNNYEEPKQTSPCMYSTQKSNIIESDSPLSSQASQHIIICSGKSSHTSPNLIDSFCSQQCTEIVFNSDPSETPGSVSSSVEPLYHEVSPKKKKRYKKNGLAYQLQKSLHKQKTDFAICRHELYLKKAKGYEVSSPYDDNLVLLLKIIKVWKEYGVTVVECLYIEDKTGAADEDSRILKAPRVCGVSEREHIITQSSSCSKNIVNSKQCLVIIGFNVTQSLRIKINAKFKLYPPYITKTVLYKGGLIFCYFNVSKLFSVK